MNTENTDIESLRRENLRLKEENERLLILLKPIADYFNMRKVPSNEDIRLCEVLLTPVVNLPISIRLKNIFKSHGIKTIGDVARLSHYDLYIKRHWGPKSREEVERLLKQYNLHLSYDVDGLLEKCRYKIK